MVDPSELAAEQRYFDHAWERREHYRDAVQRSDEGGANDKARWALRTKAVTTLNSLKGPDEGVAFGRFDTEEAETWYLGYNAVWDDNADVLVVNWQAPVAAPYYEAAYDAPMGLVRRRQYRCDQNEILDFNDVMFAQLAADVAELGHEPEVDDALLQDLDRGRTGAMQDIVRTIQAAQYGVIRSDLEQLLIIQGGPGTGKTVLALHRVSWLLYNYRDRLSASDVLVIGPSRAFIRYVRELLPGLGDRDIVHSDIQSLGAVSVRSGRVEPERLAHLKGTARMQSIVDRGLQDRISLPEDGIELTGSTRTVRFDQARLANEIARLRGVAYATGRTRLRQYLRDQFALAESGPPPADGLDSLVERLWPTMTAASFLRDLYGSEGRLLRAAGEDFSAAEVRLLYRRQADRLADEVWSVADLPVLDYAESRITGESDRGFTHIVIDEAQDLSPMQLAMVSRRSARGSMTVLGDIAQSTGPWARDTWEGVRESLQGQLPANTAELEYGYRVPRQIFEFAAELLEEAAPGIAPPKVVRDGPSEPEIVRVGAGDAPAAAVEAAMSYSAHGNLVGVVCPQREWDMTVAALQRRSVNWRDVSADGISAGINLLTPTASKGLEFDAVVVIEPEAIVAADPHGLRLLYIAYTRTIRHLTVVTSGRELPTRATLGSDDDTTRQATPPRQESREESVPEVLGVTQSSRIVRLLALDLSAEIRASVNADRFAELIVLIGDDLGVARESAKAVPQGESNRMLQLMASELAAGIRASVNQGAWSALIREIGDALGA